MDAEVGRLEKACVCGLFTGALAAASLFKQGLEI